MKKSFFIYAKLSLIVLCFASCKNSESDQSSVVPGVTDTEIKVGSWGPLTGPAALWGSIPKSIDAYFKMINDEGGIHGRKINLIYKDDAYDPSRTVPVVRELVQKEEVFAVAGGVGTAPNMAVMGFLEENKVPWVTPMTGATAMTQPIKENIYSTFTLYFDEGEIMAKHALNEMSLSKIAIIYQNDDFGKSGLVGAKKILQKNNLDFVAALPVEITDTDLSSHVARLKDSGAEAVMLWVLPRQAAIVLGTSSVVNFKPQWMASQVLSDMALMFDITKGGWKDVLYAFPTDVNYNDKSNPTMSKYQEAYKKYYPEERWGAFAYSGFLAMEPFAEALRIAGKDLTRASFLEALSSLNNYSGASGVPISFSKDKHLGSRTMYLMKCVSATEAEAVGPGITGDSNIGELSKMLEESN